MVRKTYFKNIKKMLKTNILRILTISFVIAIGMSIVTAMGTLPDKIKDSLQISSLAEEKIIYAQIASDKIEVLSYIFPTFFLAVSVLTVLITMKRFVEEERSSIACFKTIGYSNSAIIFKYSLFAAICSLFGCILGIAFGYSIVSPILFESVKAKFELIESKNKIHISIGLIWSLIMFLTIILTTLLISLQSNKENPASLLRPKTPKAGGKIYLERISFIWKPLKFKYKSTIRNIVRYKSRLIMTVLSVLGSTALVFCGFGLYTSINSLKDEQINNFELLADSILPISIVVILCAVGLAVLVIFNLTNINIEERKREIATLKVLGYKQLEVASYIFREVFILSIMGMALGLPSGYFFLGFIFSYLDFGSLEYVTAFIWLLSLLVSFIAVMLADILLYKKIDKIQMHTSLKTIE